MRTARVFVLVCCLAFTSAFACSDDTDPESAPPLSSGGTSGAPSFALPGGLGDRCDTRDDCFGGLTCLAANSDDNSLIVGTPPAGLCTLACETQDDCTEVDRRSACVDFGRTSYCVQACEFGTQPAEANKCYLRPELSCQPLEVSTGVSCSVDADCRGEGALVEAYGDAVPLCFEGECSLLPVCLPRCNSDFDCPEGRFCDLVTGECSRDARSGKAVGEPCDPKETGECRGICVELPDGSGECEENCTVGAQGGCGFADASEAPVRCEFFAFDLGREMGGQDEGSCATLCDCDAECPGEQLCFAFDDLPTAGLCLGVGNASESLGECPDSGEGGASGLGGMGN